MAVLIKSVTKILRYKTKGSTLVEVLVAMALISICFAIIVLVLGNLLISVNGIQRLKAKSEINSLLEETKRNRIFISEQKETDDLIITKTISFYNNSGNLIWLNIVATTKTGQEISHINELILND